MRVLVKALFIISIVCFSPKVVNAQCTGSACPCQLTSTTQTNNFTIPHLRQHVDDEMQAHRVWWVSILWEDNILPALMLMAEQLTAVAVKQTEIVGGFMDAKHQMETQQVLQKITARALSLIHI